MCPIVPMFTCGFDRSNFALAMRSPSWSSRPFAIEPSGAGAAGPTLKKWSPCPGLNRRPRPYQGRALPTELHGPEGSWSCRRRRPRALPGRWSGKRDSNPRPPAWKAGALPLSYSRPPPGRHRTGRARWWGEEDLNPRRRPPADLQSAPFGHLGISPAVESPCNLSEYRQKKLALAGGFEPPTHCLQGSCSTPELRQPIAKLHSRFEMWPSQEIFAENRDLCLTTS